jgi:hypothetical protein
VSDISDQELVHKLATTFHLSVPERAALRAIPVPGSLIRSAILAILKEQGSFPPQWERDSPYEGGLIEVNLDGSCSITWTGGSAVMRPAVVEVENFLTPIEAISAYSERFFGSTIDGIAIDWHA